MIQVQSLLVALDARFPLARAESWDKVGLLIGDNSAPVRCALVAYEVTDSVLDEAHRVGAEAVVAYHPLLFRPLEHLRFDNPVARLAARLISQNQALVCVHTALDGAPPPAALGDALARRLEIRDAQVHRPSGAPRLVKITTFVPPEALEGVSGALWDAGAGTIGRYDEASFRTSGLGTFRPLEGANPYSGTLGQREEAEELRLEVVAPREKWSAVVAAMKAAHPYEEVAYDVVELENDVKEEAWGPLRIGRVPAQSLPSFAAFVSEKLQPPGVRAVVPEGFGDVELVACSPGSGASFIDSLPRGSCFVTGDIKHHDALRARARGVAVLDVSHAATERDTIPLMADALRAVAGLEVVTSEVEMNPFRVMSSGV